MTLDLNIKKINDNTYRIFGTSRFKRELADSYLNSKLIRKRCLNEITNYLHIFMFDEGTWHNEYGHITSNNDIHLLDNKFLNLPNYKSIDELMIVFHYIGQALYYKILPKGSTPENCSFLCNNNNQKNYDGYFLNEYRPTNYTQYDFDKLCLCETFKIDSYDNNFRKIDKEIGMYFS
jgi:hypothetical protein